MSAIAPATALMAALLAREGFTANAGRVRAPAGLLQGVQRRRKLRRRRRAARLGGAARHRHARHRHQAVPVLRQHPSGDRRDARPRAHACADAGQRRAHRSWTHPRRLEHTNRPTLRSALDAKFSVQYCLARALVDRAGGALPVRRRRLSRSARRRRDDARRSCAASRHVGGEHRPFRRRGDGDHDRWPATHQGRRHRARTHLGESAAARGAGGEVSRLRRTRARCRCGRPLARRSGEFGATRPGVGTRRHPGGGMRDRTPRRLWRERSDRHSLLARPSRRAGRKRGNAMELARRRLLALAAATVRRRVACRTADAYPTRPVHWIVGFAPGGVDRHPRASDGPMAVRAARPAVHHREPARRRRQHRDRGRGARAAGRLHAAADQHRRMRSTRRSTTSSASISCATSRRSPASAASRT